MTLNDDDLFEEALRADLPSPEQGERARKRLMAVGLSVGSGIAATGAATTAQAGWGATLVAKFAALSWPATVVVAAAVATPIVALPVWLTPGKKPRSAAPALVNWSNVAAARAVTAGPAQLEPLAPSPSPSVGVPVVEHALGSNVLPVARVPEQVPAQVSALPAASVAAFAAIDNAGDARAPATSTLAVETQLLDRAFAELGAGNRAAAAALIAEHARRFPNGLLRLERERAQARLVRDSH